LRLYSATILYFVLQQKLIFQLIEIFHIVALIVSFFEHVFVDQTVKKHFSFSLFEAFHFFPIQTAEGRRAGIAAVTAFASWTRL